MSQSARGPAYEPFMATADSVAAARPEVGLALAREIFDEAATLLHNSLVLDGLDEADTEAVVAGLCIALVDRDPGAALRARSRDTLEDPGDLHDPEAAAAAYLSAAAVLQV